MDKRMAAAQFVSKRYYNQHPRLLEFVLSKPPDRVKYDQLSLLRENFEEIEELGKQSGILEGNMSNGNRRHSCASSTRVESSAPRARSPTCPKWRARIRPARSNRTSEGVPCRPHARIVRGRAASPAASMATGKRIRHSCRKAASASALLAA